MPCRSDYLEANPREIESRKVAQHIVYLNEKIVRKTPDYIKVAAGEYYGDFHKLDEMTRYLCETISALDEDKLDAFIYNGRVPEARKLADWWERHQEWDRKRIKEEKEQKRLKKLKKQALSKLTKEEKKALGLN